MHSGPLDQIRQYIDGKEQKIKLHTATRPACGSVFEHHGSRENAHLAESFETYSEYG
jgi:hypothetical protein